MSITSCFSASLSFLILTFLHLLLISLSLQLEKCHSFSASLSGTDATPSCKGSGIVLFYNPYLMLPADEKISPTDIHEKKMCWPFRHMKREPGSFEHAEVQVFCTISGPLLHPYEILLPRFGHRVRVRTLVATIHFSPFTCCFRRFFRRSFTGSFRNENAEFTQSL